MTRRPSSSCRIRFDENRGLDHAARLVPFLNALGVTTVSLPSILRSRSGEFGRRPVVDPTRVDPTLGGEEGFMELVRALSASEMDILFDVVADKVIATAENPFFRSVLEEGSRSPFAPWFDIDWERDPTGMRERLVLPILMVPYGEALSSGQVTVALTREGFVVRAYGVSLPLCLESWRSILGRRRAALEAAIGDSHPGVAGLRRILLQSFEQSVGRLELASRLRDLAEEHPAVKILVDEGLSVFNDALPGRGAERMHELLELQNYRLCWRGSAAGPVGTRSLSGSDDGIPFRPEDPEALTALHARLFEWADAGLVGGVTVRDVDRIGDPTTYLTSLRDRLRSPDGVFPYIVGEKIVVGDKEPPPEWDLAGTSGNDFLNAVSRLLVDPDGLAVFDGAYKQFVGPSAPGDGVVQECKRAVLRQGCAEEFEQLTRRLVELAEFDLIGRDLAREQIALALEEITVHLPVARTYIATEPIRSEDREVLDFAIHRAQEESEFEIEPRAFAFLRRLFLLEMPWNNDPAREVRDPRLDCVQSWQRLSMEVMHRSRDGAALHLDARLASLCEPGGHSRVLPNELSVDAFHAFCADRAARTPWARNAVATDLDLKGADLRARLHVLSEQAMAGTRAFRRLARLHRPLKTLVGRRRSPDANTEWLIYQLLIGLWPQRHDEWPRELKNLEGYLSRSIRQMGVRSDAVEAEEFEQGLIHFVRSFMALPGMPFVHELDALNRITRYFGFVNSLTQIVLAATAPGIPEILDGEEGWDFRLAGGTPSENLSQEQRESRLAEVLEAEEAGDRRSHIADWASHFGDGRIKTWVVSQVLRRRREHPDLFDRGEYIPCVVTGPRARHVCAFIRRLEDEWCLVATGLYLSKLTHPGTMPVGASLWGGTTIQLPPDAPSRWREALGGGDVVAMGEVSCAVLFESLPQAVCLAQGGDDFEFGNGHAE